MTFIDKIDIINKDHSRTDITPDRKAEADNIVTMYVVAVVHNTLNNKEVFEKIETLADGYINRYHLPTE